MQFKLKHWGQAHAITLFYNQVLIQPSILLLYVCFHLLAGIVANYLI